MADLSMLDNTGVEPVEFTVPNTDIVLTLHGVDSEPYINAINNAVKQNPDISVKELNALTVKGCIHGWKNVCIGEEELECTDENKDKLIAIPWIVRKTGRFIENEQNFLPKPKSD